MEQNGRGGGAVQGKTKVSFINTDDTFIQPAHNHPSSRPTIKQYVAVHTCVPHPTFFESMRLFSIVLRFIRQDPWVTLNFHNT